MLTRCFARLRKIALLLTLAAVLAVSVLGVATVAQTVTGHTPRAHADSIAGSQVAVFCYENSGDPNKYVWADVYGVDQTGNWNEEGFWLSYIPPDPDEGATQDVYWGVSSIYFTGTVYVSVYEWVGGPVNIDYWVPVWIDPSTYTDPNTGIPYPWGGQVSFWC